MFLIDEENQRLTSDLYETRDLGLVANEDASKVVVGNLCYFFIAVAKVGFSVFFLMCDHEVCNEPFELWLTFVVANEALLMIYLLLAIQLYFRGMKNLDIDRSISVGHFLEEGTHIRPTLRFIRNRENYTMAGLNGLDHYNHLNILNEDTEENFKFLVLLRQTHQL